LTPFPPRPELVCGGDTLPLPPLWSMSGEAEVRCTSCIRWLRCAMCCCCCCCWSSCCWCGGYMNGGGLGAETIFVVPALAAEAEEAVVDV